MPRDVASRNAKTMIDQRHGRRPAEERRLPRLRRRHRAGSGEDVIEERYGNLFEMYERITDEDPYVVPMRIYPAPHYTMGGLWVDYELMTNVPGLYAIGEANFSDHGANRLGASALMQGLADGYFVLPYTIGNYLAPLLGTKLVPTDHPAFQAVEAEVGERYRRLPRDQGHPLGGLVPQGARPHHVGLLRHGAHGGGPARRRCRRSRRCTTSSSKDLRVLGDDHVAQPVARAGRPGRRLLRAGHADVRRRPRSATSRAAATSGPSTRPRTARPCATTSTSPTSPRGSGPATPASEVRPPRAPRRSSPSQLTQRSYK